MLRVMRTQALKRRRHWHWLIAASIIKLRPALIDQACFEFIDVSYYGAVNFPLQSTKYKYVRIAEKLNGKY